MKKKSGTILLAVVLLLNIYTNSSAQPNPSDNDKDHQKNVVQEEVLLKSAKDDPAPHPTINLKISNNGFDAVTEIMFISGTTLGLDNGYDAGVFKSNSDLSLFTYLVESNGIQFARQCLPPNQYNSIVIQLGIDCKAGGTIVFSKTTVNLPVSCEIIVEDTYLHKFTNLKSENYSTTIEANSFASTRFKLHTSYLTNIYTWSGASDNNWNAPLNWQTGSIPLNNQKIIVPGSLINYPLISQSNTAGDLEIQSGAHLTIATNGSLTIGGTLVNLAGISGLIIESDGTGNGSLILGTGGISGTVNRWMTGDKWHQVSASTVQDVSDFLQSNVNIPTNLTQRGMMDYNSTNDQWNNYFTNLSPGNLSAGKGFMIRTTSDATVNFSGTINAGNVSIETNTLGNRWNCIGNPYSSGIKLTGTSGSTDNFYEVNFDKIDDIYSAIYIWDNSENTPAYTLVNRASVTYYATLGQGFFVKAKPLATGSFQFTPEMQFHQNAIQLKSVKTNYPEIKLLIVNNNLKARTSIKLIEGMSRGLDVGYDAGILKAGQWLNIYTRLVDDTDGEFMLQCLSDRDYRMLKIPVGFDCSAGGTLTISAETINLPDDCSVLLEDKDLEKFVDLTKNTYTITANPNTLASNRFVLHTSAMTTQTREDSFDNQLKAYVDGSSKIQIVGRLGEKAIASLYDAQGRLLLSQQLEPVTEQNVSVNDLSEGIYLLLIRNEGKQHSIKLKIN
jgi:hypothetical protein